MSQYVEQQQASWESVCEAMWEYRDMPNRDFMLHVLRNPHGWSEDTVRAVRLLAADELEALWSGSDDLARIMEGMARGLLDTPPIVRVRTDSDGTHST